MKREENKKAFKDCGILIPAGAIYGIYRETKAMKSLITRNPSILGNSYTIRGTRIPVTLIKSMNQSGEPVELLMKLYGLTKEQVNACIGFNNKKHQ